MFANHPKIRGMYDQSLQASLNKSQMVYSVETHKNKVLRYYIQTNYVEYGRTPLIRINPYPANVDNMASSYQC